MSSDRIYLDYNATSPLSKSVTDWLKSGEFVFANPMSQHSQGKASRKLINESRAKIFSTFNVSEKEFNLLFQSGATESFLTFVHSFSEWARLTGRDLLVCYSGIDHPAVTSLSEKFFGAHVKFLELELNQNLSYKHEKNFSVIQDKKENNPDLIILYHHLWIHNETGFISPTEDLARFKKIPDLYLHIDSVQVPGKIPGWRKLNEGDIWTFSPHKFGGLKGIGFSLSRKSFPFHPLLTGGGQQSGQRGGTENPMGIRSIALALGDLEQVDVSRTKKQKEDLEDFLKKELDGIGGILSGATERQNANTIYFYLNKLTSDISLALFDLNGLMISAGSACSSGAAKPATVLVKSGHQDVARNGLRLSLGFYNSDEEIQTIKKFLKDIFSKIQL